MADGGFNEISDDEQIVWLWDEKFGTGGVYRDQDYVDGRNWKPIRVIGGINPVKWDIDRDELVPCSLEQAECYLKARVQYQDGTTGIVPGDEVLPFIDDPDNLDPPPLGFLSYEDMIAMPDPEWLIQGIIQTETAGLLFGKSNAFKSFLGIDFLCSLATGTSWHGSEVKGPAPCLYIATEGSRGVGKQRIPGWMEAHEIPLELRRNVTMYPKEIALDDEAAIDDLLKTCGHIKSRQIIARGEKVGNPDDPSGAFALVVVDIFGSSMMGPETSDETARAWVRNINRIIREVGCAVLAIAHTGWADQTRARMHTHFWGSFDTRLKAEGDKDSLSTVLSVDRHKDADSAGEWGFRLDKVNFTIDGKGPYSTLVPRLCDEVETKQKRRVSGKPAVALQALSEALIENGKTIAGPNYPSCPVVTLEDWRTMCQRHGLTSSDTQEAQKKSFQRAKTNLIEKGLVKQFDNYAWKVEANA